MRVAGVAIAAAELASPVRIDGPGKGHLAPADTTIQQRLRFQREVFDIVSFTHRLAFRCEAGNADQAGLIVRFEQREGRH